VSDPLVPRRPGLPVSIAVLADRPELVEQAGVLRWTEWGYDDPSPEGWIAITAREAGRDVLPVTLVAIGSDGSAVGVVGLDSTDDALTDDERGGRTPWLVGMVVRRDSRLRDVGRALMDALAEVARDHGHDRIWVLTGGHAADYYRACGWSDVEELVTSKESLSSTVLMWALPE
jgi:GNAT superfamily N-acetyltransferase